MTTTVDTPDITVILVVDQELVRSGLRRILRRKDGFVIVAECSDGDEVPAAVAEHRPDVVVMDLRMKRVDGIEATRQIRQLPDCGPVPIIAMTANAMQGDREHCLAAGMDDYVAKPVRPKDLQTVLDTWLVNHADKTGTTG